MIIRYDQECHFIFNRTHAKRLKACPAADTSYSRGCLLRYACLSHFMHNTNNKYAIIITHRLAAECAIKSKTHVPSSLQQSTTFSNILRLIPPCVRGIRVARCHLHTTRREKRMHRKSVSYMFYIFLALRFSFGRCEDEMCAKQQIAFMFYGRFSGDVC